MERLTVRCAGPLAGSVPVPGDKSISHRALLFGALAEGDSRVRGFLDGRDCLATLGAVRTLGVAVEQVGPRELIVRGRGPAGLREPPRVVDCDNSGTTIRLLAGLLAGQPFTSFLVGTAQLQGRPMGRVTEPLRAMGARILGRSGGRYAPLALAGTGEGGPLAGIDYALPVPSAQVKSCLLLAGLFARDPTRVVEPGPTRDHTERLLAAMGAPLRTDGAAVRIEPLAGRALAPFDLVVPGDPSSAAFLVVAATLVPGSRIEVPGVGVNPTRTGLLEVLRRMGARIELLRPRDAGGEPVADLAVAAADLTSTAVGGPEVVTLIDEVPILAVAATQARGETVVRDAAELRVKETDRIATVIAELRRLGADLDPLPDGLVVRGPTPLRGARVSSHGDHRLAMALTVAGLIAEGETVIEGAEVTADSFPGFADALRALGAPVGSSAAAGVSTTS